MDGHAIAQAWLRERRAGSGSASHGRDSRLLDYRSLGRLEVKNLMLVLAVLAITSAAAAGPTTVCITAPATKDEFGFAVNKDHVKSLTSIGQKLAGKIKGKKALKLVDVGPACTINVEVLGWSYVPTGSATSTRDPWTGAIKTRQDTTDLLGIRVKVGDYVTEMYSAKFEGQIFGVDGRGAGQLANQLEEWAVENAEAIAKAAAK
jgi:hypothetical protein